MADPTKIAHELKIIRSIMDWLSKVETQEAQMRVMNYVYAAVMDGSCVDAEKRSSIAFAPEGSNGKDTRRVEIPGTENF